LKNILVTGANGQLGTEIKELAKQLKDKNFLFHDVDTLDITDPAAMEAFGKENNYDFVINCAAYTAVDKAEEDQETAALINTYAVQNLIELASQKNACFIHVSTDYVFDGTNHTPYKERDKTKPNSVYGETKLKGEDIANNYEKSIIIRTSWLYSSFGNNFVKTMLRLGAEKSNLNVIFDQVGTPTYARDLASAILNIIDFISDKGIVPAGVYHYSNEGVCSWYDFAREIMEQKEFSCKVAPIETSQYPTPAKRPHYSVLNKGKIKQTFNLEIPYWKDSLKECLNILN
jgi:dTDP-4-dehydrorhamnose reductase